MVYELKHNEQRFLLFPRHRILHMVTGTEMKNVVVTSEDAMISLLNTYKWVQR